MLVGWLCFCFFKQKTAYEMRISDWSSDVCPSDLCGARGEASARRLPFAWCEFGQAVADLEADHRPVVGTADRIAHGALHPVPLREHQIGRASCRERVCQYV